MKPLFGFTWENPPADWMFEQPATDAQINALDKQRTWRQVTPEFWHQVNREISRHLGETYIPSDMNKGLASLLLDFWIRATPAQKKAVEKSEMEKVTGQGVLL